MKFGHGTQPTHHLLVDQSEKKASPLLTEVIKAAVKDSLPSVLNHSNEKVQLTTLLCIGI